MGQYYLPILKCTKKKNNEKIFVLYAHDFDNGLKLMEHSYKRNLVVLTIQQLMKTYHKKGWKTNLIWAGDYADPANGERENLHMKYYGHISKVKIDVDKCYEKGEFNFTICPVDSNEPEKLSFKVSKGSRYIVNITKREYIDTKRYKPLSFGRNEISELALLTADGNGAGGGDYYGDDMECAGRWKNDELVLCTRLGKYVDFTEIKPNFKEE